MKALTALAAALLVLCLQGCATLSVTADYDPEATFSKMRTFAWMEPRQVPLDDVVQRDPLLEKRLVRALHNALEARGYELVADGFPDFYVGYHAAIRERIDVWSMNALYGYPPGWGWDHYHRPGYSWAYSPRLITYDEGTLVIDIVDGATRQLVWRGALQARVSAEDSTPEEKQEKLNRAVEKILARFPPESRTR